jgi:hypothetical protein
MDFLKMTDCLWISFRPVSVQHVPRIVQIVILVFTALSHSFSFSPAFLYNHHQELEAAILKTIDLLMSSVYKHDRWTCIEVYPTLIYNL